MTSDDPSRRDPRPPRRPRPDQPSAAAQPGRADQGDLWADPEEDAARASTPVTSSPRRERGRGGEVPPATGDGIDDFVADLPPPAQEPRYSAGAPAVRRPVAPPPVYEEYDGYDEAEYSMLRNPYVLAALAVAGAIILAVAFVIVFSSGGDDPIRVGGVTANTPTPQPGELPGVQAKVIAKAAIREGPGLEYFELGLLNTGQEVSVVGRNEDSSWYQILFAGTQLWGWVPDSALRLPDGAGGLIEVVVFTAIPKPSVEQPTATPPPLTPTEEALGPPDIAVEALGNLCPTSGSLTVALRNVGNVDLNSRQILLSVSNPAGVVSEQTLALTLGAGQIVAVDTGVEVQPPRMTVTVLFVSEPQDTDPSNNVLTCVIGNGDGGGPGQSATNVPPPANDDD